MCDVCSGKKVNWSLTCGAKHSKLKKASLHTLREGDPVKIKLCHLCDINLFLNGETKFLAENRKYIDFRFDTDDEDDIFG